MIICCGRCLITPKTLLYIFSYNVRSLALNIDTFVQPIMYVFSSIHKHTFIIKLLIVPYDIFIGRRGGGEEYTSLVMLSGLQTLTHLIIPCENDKLVTSLLNSSTQTYKVFFFPALFLHFFVFYIQSLISILHLFGERHIYSSRLNYSADNVKSA